MRAFGTSPPEETSIRSMPRSFSRAASTTDCSGVRGNDALARIPAEERKEWERFWAEVDALIRRASEPD
jgi:hypothetical protein